MKLSFIPVIIIFAAVIIGSCSSGKKELKKEENNPDQQNLREHFVKDPKNYTKRVLADRCRIKAAIQEIDTTRFLEDQDAPCGKYPCYATIVIDEILGYGSGFSKKLYKGQKLKVNFKFTLEPTKKIAPEMQMELPGLNPGDKFIADLEAVPVMNSKKREYTIYKYEIITE